MLPCRSLRSTSPRPTRAEASGRGDRSALQSPARLADPARRMDAAPGMEPRPGSTIWFRSACLPYAGARCTPLTVPVTDLRTTWTAADVKDAAFNCSLLQLSNAGLEIGDIQIVYRPVTRLVRCPCPAGDGRPLVSALDRSQPCRCPESPSPAGAIIALGLLLQHSEVSRSVGFPAADVDSPARVAIESPSTRSPVSDAVTQHCLPSTRSLR